MDENTNKKSDGVGDKQTDAGKAAQHEITGKRKPVLKKPFSPEKSSTDIVRDSVNRVNHLLKYAAEAGKPIDSETQQKIIDFSHKVYNGDKWDTKEESEFWSGVCQISNELDPVTYETLISSSGTYAKRYVGLFGILTVAILIFLVLCQFRWVVLGNVTNAIEAGRKELKAAELKLNDLNYQENDLEAKLVDLAKEESKNPRNEKSTFVDANETNRTDHKERLQSIRNEIYELRIKVEELNSELRSSARILIAWLPFKDWLKTSRPPEPSIFDSGEVKKEKLEAIDTWERTQTEENSFRNKALLTWAKQILQGMSSYLLPMIYGLVGACAFVLRLISKQVRELSFSRSTVLVQYLLRMILGVLAGISIGWFFKPDPSGTNPISAISPLALAFLAGYSVELLFTAMDKIISAFTSPNPNKTKAKAHN